MPPPDAAGRAWRRAERARRIAARLALSPEVRAAAQAAIDAALTARFPPGSLGRVAGYWPIQGEFDSRPYLRRTLDAGGAVALPVVVAKATPLDFRDWTPGAPMAPGVWGAEHPAEGPAVTPHALLIPLVGFDAAGHRLGYGGGFYDRTLAALSPRPLAIGLGFEIGRLAGFAAAPHDQPMNAIVTEAGAFEFHQQTS
jgi:5-formyltetrahydrofolate cyclo-ligase